MRRRYTGAMPRMIHSCPQYVLYGYPCAISAALRCFGDTYPDKLHLLVNAKDEYFMLPYDRYEHRGVKYQLYRADIPPSAIELGKLSYSIKANEPYGASLEFECEVISEDGIGVPPLSISEIFARPKCKGRLAYVELFNPTHKPVDLYDYELLVFNNTAAYDGEVCAEPDGRLPLADCEGANILGAGETAAVWGLTPNYYNDEPWLSVDAIIAGINELYFYKKYPIDPALVRGFVVDYTTLEEDGETRVLKSGICSIPDGFKPTTVMLVPRGGTANSAVFYLVYNDNFASWDTPVLRSSYWGFDVRNPRVGCRLARAELATPGFRGEYQPSKIDASAPTGTILPISPLGESYHSDKSIDIKFAVLPGEVGGDICSASVRLVLDDERILELETSLSADGTYKAAVPEEIFETLFSLRYFIVASDGTRSFSLGDAREPLTLPVYDNRGPRITSIVPSNGYAYDGRKDTTVRVEYRDISGVRKDEVYVVVDGENVTKKAKITDKALEYTPKAPLSPGRHQLIVRLVDNLGNKSTKKVTFFVSDMSAPSVYFGELHSHTSESDGMGYTRDAIEYARAAGADFFAVTDHSHYLSPQRYAEQRRVANEYNRPGSFASLYGWEMTWNNNCGYWGHINVINSSSITSSIYQTSMPELFQSFEGDGDVIAMFNHPGVAWGDFEEYSYRTRTADRVLALAEIKGASYDRQYALMLSKGWHTAPSYNEDNHRPNWTDGSPYISGVIAPALTRENIVEAIRERRVYSSADPTMKILYRVNDEWMGARLKNPDKLFFDIEISTENALGIGRIEIVAEDNIVVAKKNAGARKSVHWKLSLPVEFDYYYLRITNDKQYSVSAPVWIENRPKLKIVELRRSSSLNADEPAAVGVILGNSTTARAKEVRVDFYLSPIDGFDINEAIPYCSVCTGALKAGDFIEITRQLPELSKMRRASVVVSAIIGGKLVRSTAYILLPPVTISELMPESLPCVGIDGSELQNPFPYVVLLNNSGRDVSLDGGRLALWSRTGKVPLDERTFQTDGLVVKSHKSLVIWVKNSEHQLTVDDFNKAYNTNLVLGEDIAICERNILSTSGAGRRLDISINGEVVSRVNWNMETHKDKRAPVGRSYKYSYKAKMTPTCELYAIGAPKLDEVDARQRIPTLEVLPTSREIICGAKQAKIDRKRQKRRSELKLTAKEGAILGVSGAAVGSVIASAIATGLSAAFSKPKKKKDSKKDKK